MKMYVKLLILSTFALSCSSKQDELTASMIIAKSIEASGTNKFNNSIVQFDFRNHTYKSDLACGKNALERLTTSDTTITQDKLIYPKLTRKINEKQVILNDSIANLYGESINSVHYFVQLPMRLNDPAAIKNYVGTETIKGKNYEVVEVKFQEEGGGQDFQDVYRYWFDQDTFQLQYLAYTFLVNGGGIRFREVILEKFVESIRFVDYNNYAPKDNKLPIDKIATHFEKGELKLISNIENKNISVTLKNCGSPTD